MTSTDHTNEDPSNDGVTDGPKEPAKPKVDPDKIGPDGTVYDEDATEEAERKMTGGDS
ncbi:MAG: hypothetical protein DHS20C19_27980 [Acidimicrobiales bacterium]|nr:MAG: hypothetical protein DHS20C19_27980 [Acidimicrobiales bacterium]